MRFVRFSETILRITQRSQSLALGLALTTAPQLAELVRPQEEESFEVCISVDQPAGGAMRLKVSENSRAAKFEGGSYQQV